MNIDRNLNIVIPIERESGPVYVHAAPISRAVFERYFLVISKTFAAIHAEGLSALSGPRVAGMMLKKIAQDREEWDGPEGVERGLMMEIRRLSSVVQPKTSGGWETVPLQEALDRKTLDEDDVSEVENVLVFFTVAYSMLRKGDRRPALEGASSIWGARIESLNSTAFAASLPTSTATASSGETEGSSVPH